MYRPESCKDQDDNKFGRTSQSSERDDVQRNLASVLILRQPDGAVKSPVVTLSTERTCVYNVLEKHLKVEALLGADRWWRICKSLYRPPLEAWRPRVNGVQLKALQGARLPEEGSEWESVRRSLLVSADWIKESSSPDALLADLKDLAAYAQDWWENRTKREGSAGPSKRSFSSAPLPMGKKQRTGDYNGFPPNHLAGDIPAGVAVYRGPGGDQMQGFLELMNADQAGLLCNGTSKSNLLSLPSAEPRANQLTSQLSSRASAVTVLAGEIHETEIVPLNIGGQLLQTELSTLTAIPSSHLAQLARHWQTYPQQSIFLDRNPKVFEELLEHLRAVKSGEDAYFMSTDIEALKALLREARHFALDDIAARVGSAIELASTQRQATPSRTSSEDAWEYDMAFADTGFHVDIKEAIQLPMKSINAELQERLTNGWEIYSASSNTIGRPGRGGGEERNLSVQFLLRRPRSASPFN